MVDDRSMLSRLLTIIEVCLEQGDPVPLAVLADATGLPKPTVWRIAQSLTERDLLHRSEDGYTGGVGLVALGSRVSTHIAVRKAVTPHVAELHTQTAAAAWVVDVRSATEWPIVSSIYGRAAAATHYAETWEHSPSDPAVLASALGVVAYAERRVQADRLMKKGVPRLTPDTEIQPQRIMSLMDHVDDNGELVEHGRFRRGWSCLAVPIVEEATHRTIAVVGLVDRTPRFVTSRLLRAAHKHASEIGRDLSEHAGHSPHHGPS